MEKGGKRRLGDGLVHTFAGKPHSWMHDLVDADEQAKDLCFVLDEGEGCFDVLIRRHLECLEGVDRRKR